MPRPRKCRWIGQHPEKVVFKPLGFPMRKANVIELKLDELESLRQAHILGKTQEEGAEVMGISRATFGRILESAHQKITDALLNQKTVTIGGGPVVMDKRHFECQSCSNQWDEKFGTGRPCACPSCGSKSFNRTDAGHHRRGQCCADGLHRTRARAGGARGNQQDNQ